MENICHGLATHGPDKRLGKGTGADLPRTRQTLKTAYESGDVQRRRQTALEGFAYFGGIDALPQVQPKEAETPQAVQNPQPTPFPLPSGKRRRQLGRQPAFDAHRKARSLAQTLWPQNSR